MSQLPFYQTSLIPAHGNRPYPRNHCLRISRCLATTACLFLVMLCRTASAETWTSLNGSSSVDARMIGMWEGQVVLLLSSGRRVSVPLNSLNANSRLQADDIMKQLEKDREALAQELKTAAAIDAAPAPDPLPTPSEAEAYQAPAGDLDPDAAIDLISRQIDNGHLVVLYDALPPKYRQQLDDLVRQTTTKLSPTAWQEPLDQLRRIADLIVTRQNWILSHPRLRDPAVESDELTATGETVEKLAIPLAALIRAAIPADAVSLETIRTTGFGPWLHERDAEIAPYLAPLMSQFSSPASQWSLVSSENETAILEKPGPVRDQPSSSSSFSSSEPGYDSAANNNIRIELTEVDGYWIPTAVAEGFEDWIKQQTAALEPYEDGQMTLADWLGGQFTTAPTAPVVTQTAASGYDPRSSSSGYPGSPESSSSSGNMESGYPSSSSYSDSSSSSQSSSYPESPSSSESSGYPSSSSSSSSSGYPSDPGDSSGGGGAPRMIEPSPLTPQLVGTLLQSIGAYTNMITPLESAADAAAFHQAVDQLVGPIQGVMSLISR